MNGDIKNGDVVDAPLKKWDPWDPVGLDKTHLVGQREISTHCILDKTRSRLNITHSKLDKLTADWTNSQQIGKTHSKLDKLSRRWDNLSWR